MTDIAGQLVFPGASLADALARTRWAATKLGLQIRSEDSEGFHAVLPWYRMWPYSMIVKLTPSGDETLAAISIHSSKFGVKSRLKSQFQAFADLCNAPFG